MPLTADGQRAVSRCDDNTLKVWDLESGRALRTLKGHSSCVTDVALTADGKRAVSASEDNTLKIWDLESGRALRTLKGHSSSVTDVALTADGKRAVSASSDKTLKIWDLESGACIASFHCDGAASCCTCLGDTIVAGDERGRVLLLRLEENEA